MKKVIITGASGFLGHYLVKKFLNDGETNVVAILGRPEDKANELPVDPNLEVIPCDSLYTTDFGHVDTLIHTAFARGENMLGLSASIVMTRKVIQIVNEQNIDSIINISSQGVYKGLEVGQKATEDSGVVGPSTTYGMAKWCVENMLELGCRKHYTSIRMASLSANARFLMFFVNSVKSGNDITITAPNQYASIMDVSDAVNGIYAVSRIPLLERKKIYNLGPGLQYSILEYANTIAEKGFLLGYPKNNIIVADSGKRFAICMDCTCLEHQTGWTPQITKEIMINKLF